MNLDTARAAADILARHWQEGTCIAALPDELRPRTRAEGYAIQACIEGFTNAPLYGWKIAATSPAGQAHIAVDGPLAGRLLQERVVAAGSVCPLEGNRMRVGEIEFAFRMGRTLDPRTEPYSLEEVMSAVDTLHPAIEIPDSRFEPFERAGEAQLIADNACAHRFALGEAAPDAWRGMDLASYVVCGQINDGPRHEGVGRNVLDDPRLALAWLANELSGLGIELRAGQVVTTGACVPPMPFAPGDRIHGDFGALGEIAITMAQA
ncbi:MAG TPA: fumarylacetoacetate hydrolase family protein [Sphingobium sp.]|nr:fumarylacetoacetate hydrolase family protein [Sphingobium sp.]